MSYDKWFRFFEFVRDEMIKTGKIKSNEKTDGKVIDYIINKFAKKGKKIKAIKNYLSYSFKFPSNFSNIQIQICVKDLDIITIDSIESCEKRREEHAI
ncbi:hypothetical protein [Marinitoga aeolica]|uniref:Uncharacterized protein n=1 Tax=Marinitoga aeolica TaxID=2809031 RepID=A0ABY8PPU5_9BACT|nr:hypothetical protein [Marinitoga aeolica]WGS64652.1 hypothetical protein JRV97_09840 [Marinitoga aeolica]